VLQPLDGIHDDGDFVNGLSALNTACLKAAKQWHGALSSQRHTMPPRLALGDKQFSA